LEEFLREAQKVYVRQDEEKQKQKTKILLSTIGQITQEKNTFQRVGPTPAQNTFPEGKSNLTGFRGKEREQVLLVWEARTLQTRIS
jgi:hypothetical protein